MKKKEIWKVIDRFPHYRFSNFGRVKSLFGRHGKPERIISTHKALNHYERISLHEPKSKTYLVHRLIMEAFYGPSTLHVNHKNGNKHDNRIENIEYVTCKQNTKHAIAVGLFKTGESTPGAKLNNDSVRFIRNSSESNVILAKKFGVCHQTISSVRRGINWKYLE